MALNYADKTLFRVPITSANGTINYIYQSNVDLPAGDLTILGVVAVDPAAIPAGSVFQANSPKPARMRRFNPTRLHDSSFVASAQIGAAKADDWTVAAKAQYAPVKTSGGRTQTVYVEVGGIRYAWNMHSERIARLSASLAALGITIATQNDRASLVWGATAPKPAQASTTLAGVGGTDVITVFVGQAEEDNLPTGWTITKARVDIADVIGGVQPTTP